MGKAGRFSIYITLEAAIVGPECDLESSRPCGVCRTGSSLAAHIHDYTGKTLV